MKKSLKMLLLAAMMVSVTSCDISSLLGSVGFGGNESNENTISLEDYVKTQLELVKDYDLSYEDVTVYKVESGSLLESGCNQVIYFKKGNNEGYIYNCTVKGYGGDIVFQIAFANGVFLGYLNISNNETSSYGGKIIDGLNDFLKGKHSQTSLKEHGFDSYISGVSITGNVLGKTIEECRKHYTGETYDNSNLIQVKDYNELFPKLPEDSSENVPSGDLHYLQELGLNLKSGHKIVENSANGNYYIQGKNSTDVAVIYHIKGDNRVIIEYAHGASFVIDVYVAININDGSLYGIAYEKVSTDKNWLAVIKEWVDTNLLGKTITEINQVDTIGYGASYSAEELKQTINKAYDKYYDEYHGGNKPDEDEGNTSTPVLGTYYSGIGYCASYSSNQASRGQVDLTAAFVVFDENDVIVDARIDVVQMKVIATIDGGIALTSYMELDGSVSTKLELGRNYNMIDYSPIGLEVDRQIENFADWTVGKTVLEIKEKIDPSLGHGIAPHPDLESSVTITCNDFVNAIENAYKNKEEKEIMYTSNCKAGIGMYSYIAYNYGAPQTDVDICIAGALVDNGKVVCSEIDEVIYPLSVVLNDETNEYDITPNYSSKYFVDYELYSKNSLKDNYGMSQFSGLGLEWYEQANVIENASIGKTYSEINFFNKAEGELASATMTISNYVKALSKAVMYSEMIYIGPQA